MIYFYDTCSLLNNSKEIFASKQKFIISSITINELENIKTSDKKDAETKYQARVLLRLLDKYDYLYEIATYKRKYNWIIPMIIPRKYKAKDVLRIHHKDIEV